MKEATTFKRCTWPVFYGAARAPFVVEDVNVQRKVVGLVVVGQIHDLSMTGAGRRGKGFPMSVYTYRYKALKENIENAFEKALNTAH